MRGMLGKPAEARSTLYILDESITCSSMSARTSKRFRTGTVAGPHAIDEELTAAVGLHPSCMAVLDILRAGPAVCHCPGARGPGVAAVGPCPPRLPPPDRQVVRPRGEATGVEASVVAVPPAAFALFAAATALG